MPTVIVGLSGGVDSAVAAYLLQQKKYHVICATAVLWPGSLCCGEESIQEAKRIAARLGLEHLLINVIPQFGREVIKPFVEDYYQGVTPNPCTVCNRQIKFGEFFQAACRELNCAPGTYFATGHYAEIIRRKDRSLIRQGRDKAKDQSYMLYNLTQEQLARTIFPLARYAKSQVKKLAQKIGLEVHDRPESQDACFVNGDYKKFIREYSGIKPQPGNFVDQAGKVLGRHQGIPFYTVGQRRGLNISAKEPLYVLKLDPKRNTIVLGLRRELLAEQFTVRAINWLIVPGGAKIAADIKVRYNSPAVRGEVNPATGEVKLFKKIEAITPGQAAVFYQGQAVIGGGVINKP